MKPPATGKKSRNLLTGEDRMLWNRVAKTITPLPGKTPHLLKDDMARLLDAAAPSQPVIKSKKPAALNQPVHPTPPPARLAKQDRSHPIEETIVRKLAKGRLAIDSRIDLHGMTQDRARFALLDFLQQSQLQGHRIVLVITGKGSSGQGVLRTNVPHWLNLPGFKELVNGSRHSHVSHGGEGALYVRLHHHPRNRRAK